MYIGQKGERLADIPARHPAVDAVYAVSAGKFRRYHGEGVRQLLDLRTQAQNARDVFRVAAGIWQSFRLLRRLRPDIIFTRGGFVSVPVALAGKLLSIPYITHDSDSTPSLANRAIARWAVLHAVALPAELYPYPADKTVTVGVPVSAAYVRVTSEVQQEYRRTLQLDQYKQIVFVTGGGNGAAQLNDVVIRNASQLLAEHPELAIIHIAGRSLADEARRAYDQLGLGSERRRIIIKDFVTDMYRYSGAADVVISRGGATGLAEFAAQGKACVIIPARQLAWQIHHADTLHREGAIIHLSEADSEQDHRLAVVVGELLDDAAHRRQLAARLAHFARPDAAHQLAMVLLEQAGRRGHNSVPAV